MGGISYSNHHSPIAESMALSEISSSDLTLSSPQHGCLATLWFLPGLDVIFSMQTSVSTLFKITAPPLLLLLSSFPELPFSTSFCTTGHTSHLLVFFFFSFHLVSLNGNPWALVCFVHRSSFSPGKLKMTCRREENEWSNVQQGLQNSHKMGQRTKFCTETSHILKQSSKVKLWNQQIKLTFLFQVFSFSLSQSWFSLPQIFNHPDGIRRPELSGCRGRRSRLEFYLFWTLLAWSPSYW